MPVSLPVDPIDILSIRPWPDPVIDAVGIHPCSSYVETYWLGILGPSTTWLLRHVVTLLESTPAGFDLPVEETARRIGVGFTGRQSPFLRTLGRLVRFQLAQVEEPTVLAVRLRVPPLTRGQLLRLPDALQRDHASWQEHQLRTSPLEQQRRRARQLALSYLEAGLDLDETERQLMRLKYHPALGSDAVRWAADRHKSALAASLAPASA